MSYKVLFEVALRHDYERDGRSRAFKLVPDLNTQHLLRGHALRVKASTHGITVLYRPQTQEDPSTLESEVGIPFIPIAEHTIFRFGMILQNFAFPAYTDLSVLEALADPDPVLASEKVIPAWNNEALSAGGSLSPVKRTRSLFQQNTWGEIAISYKHFHSLSQAPVFEVAFEAKAELWRYYIQIEADENADHFNILSSGSNGAAINFEAAEELSLPTHATDPIFVSLQAQSPELKTLRIQSQAAVKYRELTRAGIQLRKNNTAILPNLPNPSAQAGGIYILNLL